MKKPANSTIIELFKVNLGNKTKIAESLNVARKTLYEWIENDKDLSEAIRHQEEANIDFVESKLFEKIKGIEMVKLSDKSEDTYYTLPPSDTAIIFFLKTRAKDRGYVERQEITGKDGKDFPITGFNYIPPNGSNGKTNGQATPRISKTTRQDN